MIKRFGYEATADLSQAQNEFERLKQVINENTTTVASLEKELNNLRDKWRNATKGSEEWKNLSFQIRDVRSELNSAYSILEDPSSIDRFNNSMFRARITTSNFNRVIQDSPYLFGSFQNGIIAIGNNIDPLVVSFQQLHRETGSVKGAFQAMLSSLSGGGGLVTLIGLATAGITAFALASNTGKKDVEDFKKEMEELAKEAERFSRYTLTLKLAQAEVALSEINNKIKREREAFTEANKGGLTGAGSSSFVTSSAYEVPELDQTELNRQKELVSIYSNQIAKLGDIRDIENRITELRNEQKDIKDNIGLSETYTRWIKDLEDWKKVFEGTYEVEETKSKAIKNAVEKSTDVATMKDFFDTQAEYYKLLKWEAEGYFEFEADAIIRRNRKYLEMGMSLVNVEKMINFELEKLTAERNKMFSPDWTPDALSKGSREIDMRQSSRTKTEAEIRKEYDMLWRMSKSASKMIEGEFINMWNNIFGEANSLLEKFVQAMLEAIWEISAEEIGRSIFDTFLNFATGGLWTTFSNSSKSGSGSFTSEDFASGKPYNPSMLPTNSNGYSMSGNINKVQNIYVGGEKIMQLVDGVIVESIGVKKKKRYIN